MHVCQALRIERGLVRIPALRESPSFEDFSDATLDAVQQLGRIIKIDFVDQEINGAGSRPQ
jgi:hypothetical protein